MAKRDGEPNDAPTMDDVRLALEAIKAEREALERERAALAGDQSGGGFMAILDRFAGIQESQTRVARDQLKQTRRRSNDSGPARSVFNPRGQKDYPMPELKCEVTMGFQQKPGLHGLDREEVELLNLLQPGQYPITLNDDSEVIVCVVARSNRATNVIESMTLSGPLDPDTGQYTALFTQSNKQQFPALRVMLRDMLGAAAVPVMTMKAEREAVAAYLAGDPVTRDLDPNVLVQHATADHRGPLAISVGE